jgi:hypothetical protein
MLTPNRGIRVFLLEASAHTPTKSTPVVRAGIAPGIAGIAPGIIVVHRYGDGP